MARQKAYSYLSRVFEPTIKRRSQAAERASELCPNGIVTRDMSDAARRFFAEIWMPVCDEFEPSQMREWCLPCGTVMCEIFAGEDLSRSSIYAPPKFWLSLGHIETYDDARRAYESMTAAKGMALPLLSPAPGSPHAMLETHR